MPHPLPRPAAARNLQWVLSGIAETAPVQQTRKGKVGGRLLTNREQRDLKLLRRLARAENRDPDRVVLPLSRRRQQPRRLQPSRFNLLQPPGEMNASEVGRAATIAAREPMAAGPAFWLSLGERANALLPSMDTQDLALLLNGMSRARHFDPTLTNRLRECALVRVKYFNARHLTMLLAALAKLRAPVTDIAQFLPQLHMRVSELRGASELAMAVATLSRLHVECDDLIRALASQIEVRLSSDQFHMRDIASVSAAYIRLQFSDRLHFGHLVRCARTTLHEATPRELARVVLAATQARAAGVDELATRAAQLATNNVKFMLPAEVVDTAFAFGHALEAGLGKQDTIMMFVNLISKASQACDHLNGWQLISVVGSCARWLLPVASLDLAYLVQALGSRCDVLQPTLACKALCVLTQLLTSMNKCSRGHRGNRGVTQDGYDETSQSHQREAHIQQANLETVGDDRLIAATHAAALAFDSRVRQVLADGASVVGVEALVRAVEAAFVLAFDGWSGEGAETVSLGPPLSCALATWLERSSLEAAVVTQLREKLLELGGSPENPILKLFAEYAAIPRA